MSSRKRSPRVLALRRRRTSLVRSLENLEPRIVLSQASLIPSQSFIGPVAPSQPASTPSAPATPKNTGTTAGTEVQSPHLVMPKGMTGGPVDNPVEMVGGIPVRLPIVQKGAPTVSPFGKGGPDQLTGPNGYTPQQLQSAYGINTLMWGNVKADGAGQTIAVIDIGDNPSFQNSSSATYTGML